MKKVNNVLILIVIILLISGLAELNAAGFSISGGRIIDANGNDFVIRGISHAHCWYTDKSAAAISNIKSVGANTVRLVLSNGVQWTKTSSTELANLIDLCKTNKLIAIPEVHDTTGYGEASAACTLAQAVSYWTEMKSVLTGQEAYVIINIGNEPYGNTNAANWVPDTISAIKAMRSAGFTHTLLVDATNWGQDWSFTTRDNAASIYAADTLGNTIIAIHMYGVFDTDVEVNDYLNAFVNNSYPIIVGEFGYMHSDGDPNEAAIMARCQEKGIGWMAWSWCGNGGGVEYLDMVTGWDVNALTAAWGQVVVNGLNGLTETSMECSVLTEGTPGPTLIPTDTPAPTLDPGDCTCDAGCGTRETITIEFTKDGSGEFCYEATCLGTYVNSWSLSALKINGTDYTNKYVTSSSVASINGKYYIYYRSSYSYGHLEIKGSCTSETTGPTAPPSDTAAPTDAPVVVTSAPTDAPVDTIAPTTPPADTAAPTDTPAPTAVPTATPVGVTADPTAPPSDTPASTDVPTTPPAETTAPGSCTCANLCSSTTAVTVPFTKDGSGEFCYTSSSLGSYVNSWNTDVVNVNGVVCTNTYTSASSIAAVNGVYYIYLKASYSWSHMEIK